MSTCRRLGRVALRDRSAVLSSVFSNVWYAGVYRKVVVLSTISCEVDSESYSRKPV